MTTYANFNKQTPAIEVTKAFSDRILGKNIIVTGVNRQGLGYAIAEAVAAQGPALVIVTYRSKAKGDEVLSDLRSKFPNVQFRPLEMDLSSQMSVRGAAKEVNKWPESIDYLFNNAGVMSVQGHQQVDGMDIHFATNHLGHFLFTNLILDKLLQSAKASPPGATRIVNMSGGWHSLSPVRFDDLNFQGNPIPPEQQPNSEKLVRLGFDPTIPYVPEVAYGQSKSANILHSLYLTQKLAKHGILSFAVCPGGILTEIGRHVPEQRANEIIASGILDKTQEQGAAPICVAAFDPLLNENSGVFLENCQLSDPMPWAKDPANAERLWHVSEELVKERFSL